MENLIQRATILAPGEEVGAAHLPLDLGPAPDPQAATGLALPPDATLADVERIWIRDVLDRCSGNKAEAARRLGIDPSTLHRKLKD